MSDFNFLVQRSPIGPGVMVKRYNQVSAIMERMTLHEVRDLAMWYAGKKEVTELKFRGLIDGSEALFLDENRVAVYLNLFMYVEAAESTINGIRDMIGRDKK